MQSIDLIDKFTFVEMRQVKKTAQLQLAEHLGLGATEAGDPNRCFPKRKEEDDII